MRQVCDSESYCIPANVLLGERLIENGCINNIYEEDELDKISTCQNFRQVRTEGIEDLAGKCFIVILVCN